MEKIHERLKFVLAQAGLTAAQAARDAGEADSQGLRDVLSGRKRLTAELLGALVDSTGIDAAYVLTGKKLSDRVAEAAAGLPGRLKEIRENHGMDTVTKIAKVTALQWMEFEECEGAPRLPQGFLQRLIEGLHLDVMKLLTGESETIKTKAGDETILLKNYRACSIPDQEAIRHQAAFLANRSGYTPITPTGQYKTEEPTTRTVHETRKKTL